jgi:predicted DNA-binding protein (MmcQ/YjbR family)
MIKSSPAIINKKHWNAVEIGSGIPDAELCKMIDHSYELVVEGLPKKTHGKLRRSRRMQNLA